MMRRLFFFRNLRWGFLKKPHKRKLMRRGVQRAKVSAPLRSALDKRHWRLAPFVQGYRECNFPVQVKGGSHCPVEVMLASFRTGYCLTLKPAGLAAKLPFSKAALARERREIIGLNETDKA